MSSELPSNISMMVLPQEEFKWDDDSDKPVQCNELNHCLSNHFGYLQTWGLP